MIPENFVKEEKIIDLMKAQMVALKYFALFGVIFGLPFFLMWGFRFPKVVADNLLLSGVLPIVVFTLGIVAHELIHGIFFAIYAKKGIRSVKFGVLWKMLTPYCHCKEPLQIKHYKIALLAPLVFLGLIPAVISLFTGNLWMLIFGIVFSGSAAGDLMIYDLIKKENPQDYVQDHPLEAGYFIFRER